MLTKRHPLSLEETRVFKRLVTALKEYPINSNLDCGTKKTGLTAHTKQPQHHFPPRASTACISSVILALHFLHFGERSFSWHVLQYGYPL